jgi:hypothetical protein
MQWLESPLKSKGPRFEPFLEFYFSFTNEMEQPCSQRRKSSFSPRTWLFPRKKKGLSCSPRQLKFLLPKDMIVPWGKRQLFRKTMYFLRERPKFPMKTYISNLFAIIIISRLFLHRLANYYWKGLKENYNCVVRSTPIKNSYAKIMITQIFKHICSSRTWLFPKGTWFPRDKQA